MSFFSHFKEQFNQVVEGDSVSLSHELIAGAAAYEAAKAYEDHLAANGKPDSHAEAKKILAAFAGAAVDRLAETKGVEVVEKLKAKHQADKHVEEVFTEKVFEAKN